MRFFRNIYFMMIMTIWWSKATRLLEFSHSVNRTLWSRASSCGPGFFVTDRGGGGGGIGYSSSWIWVSRWLAFNCQQSPFSDETVSNLVFSPLHYFVFFYSKTFFSRVASPIPSPFLFVGKTPFLGRGFSFFQPPPQFSSFALAEFSVQFSR